MYFNQTTTDWRISQCCQFHDKALAKKFNFTDRIFTIIDGKIVSAITDCPCMSINNYIKFNNS